MSSSSRPYEVRAEPDRVHTTTASIIVIVGLVIVFLSGVWVTVALPARHVIDMGIQGEAPRDLHMVFQTLIQSDHATERLHQDKLRELNSFGWVDKEHGIIRIPIDRAMRLVEERR